MNADTGVPLAERMRPQRLSEIVGQEYLLEPDGVLRKMIAQKRLCSMIFWGPPGVGKTTLAGVLASELHRPFTMLSAVSAGVKEVREAIEKSRALTGSILFIDEIHRFNKGQQDALLHAVEKGVITLIGATTENPSFEVNSALLSRCQVYVLKELEPQHLMAMANRALQQDLYLKQRHLEIKEYEALLRFSDGDGRKLYNLLELAAEDGQPITNELVSRAAQRRMARYDKKGEQHYDIISAFIKSMRGSDPNAAVYYLARMIEGGEDARFISRRMLILASEDIGNANPTAMVMAANTFQAVEMVGYPEARILLSQCAVYLACSPKSNASYMAIEMALQEVRNSGDLPVPLSIRNAPTKLMKKMDYGKGYQYAHNYTGNFTPMEFMPDALQGKTFYVPGDNAREAEMRNSLKQHWKEKYNY